MRPWTVFLLGCLAGPILPQEASIPRQATPSAQLELARRVKSSRRGSPSQREERTRQAIAAYRAVRLHFPWATRLGGEASFRAGELLRATGDVLGARGEFQLAHELAPETSFAQRAHLALARLDRTAGEWSAALAELQAVVANPNARADCRDEAWLWIGRVRYESGRADAARQAWSHVAEHAHDPLDRVRAYDFLGTSWIDIGDLEAAAGVLDACMRALTPIALEATNSGEKTRRALSRMRLVRRLRDEIESRMRSSR